MLARVMASSHKKNTLHASPSIREVLAKMSSFPRYWRIAHGVPPVYNMCRSKQGIRPRPPQGANHGRLRMCIDRLSPTA